MTNRSKDIGTRAETGVVLAARRLGFPGAHRVVMAGGVSTLDVSLTADPVDGVAVQVKAGEAARTATPAKLGEWWGATALQADRAEAALPLLVVARRGVSPARAEHWRAFLDLGDVVALASGHEADGARGTIVEAPFGEVLALLGRYGWSAARLESVSA